jgi:flavin-dependent dehydrogenase
MAIVGEWESRDGWSLPDPSHTIVESFERGWAWSVPLSATRRQVTAMVDPAHTKIEGKGRLAAVYAAEVARTTHIARMVSATTARQLGDCWARDASPYLSSAVAGDNRLLVGDAASFVDPLSSFGVKKALASAWLAAIVAHTCLTRAERAAAAIGFYESRERAMFEALSRRAAEFSRDAAGRHGHPFW